MIKVQFEFDNWADFMRFTDQLDHKSEITGPSTEERVLKPAIEQPEPEPEVKQEPGPGRGHVVTKKKKVCPNCGKEFQPRANRQKYCSDSCKP